MIVSWNWLKEYVPLNMSLAELEQQLMMSGLNHEGTEEVGDDVAIDLEVTSNRPDCLGHIGVAREVAVLWGQELKIPSANVKESKTSTDELTSVRIECSDLCSRYTARVIKGVKVGPSPQWLARRLKTLGIVPINNVVDISNYVMMEIGQPLHVFDFGKLKGSKIIVRRPKPKETIEAINHNVYQLEADMCVIADAEDAVAIGGVMGDAATEISEQTTDVLVEVAEFHPISIRKTARQLNLHSDSSYRFERRVDPDAIDWASRRCCELILEMAGGELCKGAVDVGLSQSEREPIVLRLSQLKRVIGIEIPAERTREILTALGNTEIRANKELIEVVPPSWRRDLTREIDLVEEVVRIYGYDKIPEDVGVPMVASTRRHEDRVMAAIRHVLAACGFNDAMTLSMVDESTVKKFSPWTDAEPLRSLTPTLRGSDRLRLSLIPSLLTARRTNETLANTSIELFEIAKVYLPRDKQLPDEQYMLGLTSGRDFLAVKGIIETLVSTLNRSLDIESTHCDLEIFDPKASCQLRLDGQLLGFVGQLSPDSLKSFELRNATTVAEMKFSLLFQSADLIPQHVPQPPYPAMARDLNLVVDKSILWADVSSTVCSNCEQYFESLEYLDTYCDDKRLGPNKKSLLMSLVLRSHDGTMTNQDADRVRDRIVAACAAKHRAELR